MGGLFFPSLADWIGRVRRNEILMDHKSVFQWVIAVWPDKNLFQSKSNRHDRECSTALCLSWRVSLLIRSACVTRQIRPPNYSKINYQITINILYWKRSHSGPVPSLCSLLSSSLPWFLLVVAAADWPVGICYRIEANVENRINFCDKLSSKSPNVQ